jgi:hypothetical protein
MASGEWTFLARYSPLVATRHLPFLSQIRHIWPVFRLLCLDSGGLRAISPANPARDFLALFVFVRLKGLTPIAQELKSIPTEEKAGPDLSEAGIEHEGIKRCSQSSKPAAGNTASFRMMCSR